jgi:hypothetical protein
MNGAATFGHEYWPGGIILQRTIRGVFGGLEAHSNPDERYGGGRYSGRWNIADSRSAESALARLRDGRRGLAMVPKQTTGTKILPVAIAGEVLTALTDCAPDHGLRLKVVLLSWMFLDPF